MLFICLAYIIYLFAYNLYDRTLLNNVYIYYIWYLTALYYFYSLHRRSRSPSPGSLEGPVWRNMSWQFGSGGQFQSGHEYRHHH